MAQERVFDDFNQFVLEIPFRVVERIVHPNAANLPLVSFSFVF